MKGTYDRLGAALAGCRRSQPHIMSTVALILAAGESRRFGAVKQLVDWHGVPLLEYVIGRVGEWAEVDGVYVVLGANCEEIMGRVDLSSVTVIENCDWREGVASSLRVGLDALIGERTVNRVLITLGDQPTVSSDVVPRLLAAGRRTRRPVTIPRYRFVRGHPVLIERSLWPRLVAGLEGDHGARNQFLSHPEWVEEVLIGQPPPPDIDTPDDLDSLRASSSTKG